MIRGSVTCPECDALQKNDWSDLRAGKEYQSACQKCRVKFKVVLLECEQCGWSDVLVKRIEQVIPDHSVCPVCDCTIRRSSEGRDNTLQ